jgi:hypothetical protein
VSPETLDSRHDILEAALDSLYPAIELTRDGVELDQFPLSGFVLGVPTAKPPDPGDGALQLDRLIRSLSGLNWACLVLAEPVDEGATTHLRNAVLNEIRSVQAAAQAEKAPSPLASSYSELLTVALRGLSSGLEVGLWRTGVYLLGDEESYYRLAGVWRGIFSGDESLPEPVRVWDGVDVGQLAVNWALPDMAGAHGPGHFQHPVQYQTLLTSNQLATYVHLPQLETNGFRVSTVPDFDGVPPSLKGDKKIGLGTVNLRSRPTEARYEIALNDLSRHALVAGVTGAGKTNTIFHLLRQAVGCGVPFLVLEPAKTEYRALLNDQVFGDLRVFTLGDEQVSPFRLNPFEVPEGVTVSQHLDLLRAVFAASFGMWTPLPEVLERCLHEIYRDRGWDLASNSNSRLEGSLDLTPILPNAFRSGSQGWGSRTAAGL